MRLAGFWTLDQKTFNISHTRSPTNTDWQEITVTPQQAQGNYWQANGSQTQEVLKIKCGYERSKTEPTIPKKTQTNKKKKKSMQHWGGLTRFWIQRPRHSNGESVRPLLKNEKENKVLARLRGGIPGGKLKWNENLPCSLLWSHPGMQDQNG